MQRQRTVGKLQTNKQNQSGLFFFQVNERQRCSKEGKQGREASREDQLPNAENQTCATLAGMICAAALSLATPPDPIGCLVPPHKLYLSASTTHAMSWFMHAPLTCPVTSIEKNTLPSLKTSPSHNFSPLSFPPFVWRRHESSTIWYGVHDLPLDAHSPEKVHLFARLATLPLLCVHPIAQSRPQKQSCVAGHLMLDVEKALSMQANQN